MMIILYDRRDYIMVAKLYGIPSWEKVGVSNSNNKWDLTITSWDLTPTIGILHTKMVAVGYQRIHRSLLVCIHSGELIALITTEKPIS